MIPQYLSEQAPGQRVYGLLTYEDGYYNLKNLEPAVKEMAKRVFPGCHTWRGSTDVRFRATRRMVGELNWLMMRYPLHIECPEHFGEDRRKAILHAERRERNQNLEPTTPPPTFQGELYPYQAEGLSYMTANERTLVADSMGLGKTVQALAALAAADAFPALVVAETNIMRQWQRMAGAWLDMPSDQHLCKIRDREGQFLCHVLKGLKPYSIAPQPKIWICHYGLLRGWVDELLEVGFKAIVFDEIQALRHTGTKKYSAASKLAGEVRYVWGLSGTPIYNYGDEIWSVLNILDFHCLGDHDSFTREWCTGYGTKIVEKPEALSDHLKREGLMIRRRKEDVQKHLPPKRRIVHVVDKDDDLYTSLIAKAVEVARGYEHIKEWKKRGEAALFIDAEARQATGISKAPYVAAFVQSLLEAGERVLVYAWHHRVHDEICSRLKDYKPVRVTGRESQRDREEAIRAFSEGHTSLIDLSLRSAAGVDGLQERGTCVVFAELDWSPACHAQCEDRLHRLGVNAETESILCYYMVTDTGHDEVMQEALGLKVGQFVGIMGDRPETEEDRHLAQHAGKKHIQKVIERLKGKAA